MECYERLKGKNGGATVFQPLSTGITFALTEKAPGDKIPLITAGYGRADSADGNVFKWNFPLLGTLLGRGRHPGPAHRPRSNGGFDKLKGKKIALVYHDSPYGKEPIPLLQERSKMHGFELQLLPVTHPGVEQKSTWLQIRQSRPDYVFLWGWGVMNSTALKEAVATGYPRDKMYGVWWAGAEPDVKDVGEGAKGYNALALQHGAEPNAAVTKEILAKVYDKGQGTGPKEEVGQVLYMRGVLSAMLGVEGVKRAQERYGKGKVMTGEQVRWGLENLALDQKKLDALGFAGVMRPVSTSCADHMGSAWARIQTWDGTKWNFTSDWYQADDADHQADGQGVGRQVRQREEARHARSACGLPDLMGVSAATVQRRRRARHSAATGERAADPSRRQRHRGHLQPRDPGAEGRVAAGARGQDRRAPGRQRRRQDDDPARGEQPARRRARRGDQGLDRAARRAHREAQHLGDGRARRGAGDGRPALLRAPDDRGEPARPAPTRAATARPRSRRRSTRSTATSRA